MKHRTLLASFELPLECAPTGNNVHQGIRAKIKRQALESMNHQARVQGLSVGVPFPKGCLIRCIRHSTTQPDSVDGNKIPIDRLLPTRQRIVNGKTKTYYGLGLIGDDSPEWVTRTDSWRRAKPKRGKFVLEVWGPCQLTRTSILRSLDAQLISCDNATLLSVLDMVT